MKLTFREHRYFVGVEVEIESEGADPVIENEDREAETATERRDDPARETERSDPDHAIVTESGTDESAPEIGIESDPRIGSQESLPSTDLISKFLYLFSKANFFQILGQGTSWF